MALITRLTRLFRADFHAVLDRVEEPEVLLRQAVREMEEDLAGDEQRLRLLQHEHAGLQARDQELEHSRRGADEELDICFESGKDDLARSLIRRRLEAERLGDALRQKRREVEATLARTRTRVEENRSRLEGMRQKMELLAADTGVDDSGQGWELPASQVRDEEVEIAFLREKKRRTGS